MFIVLPYLSSSPVTFGVYSVCISVSIFLSYADMGFVSAGQKYASEYFARSEFDSEIKVMGFANFIYLIFLLILTLCFFGLSLSPEFLVKNSVIGNNKHVASTLFFLLALFTPLALFQRTLQIIFGNRMEEFIFQRVSILFSLFRILSVPMFFRNNNYEITKYYLLTHLLNLLLVIILIIIVKRRYDFNFKLLIKSMKFSKEQYLKTKKLAFSGLYLTILWILYYEIDYSVIARYFGEKEVGIYAIGFSLLSFFRGILGIFFSPFNYRFNHFVGLKDNDGLKIFCRHLIILSSPIVIMPIITIALTAKPLILSWVGVNYIQSIPVAQFLVLSNVFAFIAYPGAIILRAQENIKSINILSSFIVIGFWVGVFITYPIFGIKAFAIFKFLIFTTFALFYLTILYKFLDFAIFELMKEIIFINVIPIIFLFISIEYFKCYLPHEKSKINLLIVTFFCAIEILISFFIVFLLSKRIKLYFLKSFFNFKNNIISHEN